jgi:hypothetical protein
MVILQAEGFINLGVFGELSYNKADSMMHILSRRTFPPVANIPMVTFPVRATVNVKALSFWAGEQERIGASPVPGNFTVRVMDIYKHRMKEDKEYVKSRNGDKPTPP